jgi:hypothetical protein
MESRRSFIKKSGKDALFTTMALGSAYAHPFPHDSGKERSKPEIRIGIIGAENAHTIGFGKMFNIEKKIPGIEVQYVWGETEDFARRALGKGGIPEMVSLPDEILGKIDALIVDHRHAKYHLEAAVPLIEP